MNILSQEFGKFREQFRDKMEEVRKTFEKMEQKYKDCDDFSNNVLAPNKFYVDGNDKEKEDRLLKEYEDALEEWEEAVKKFLDFCKEHPGLI